MKDEGKLKEISSEEQSYASGRNRLQKTLRQRAEHINEIECISVRGEEDN